VTHFSLLVRAHTKHPGADGNGREQTRHGYPFGRHHIEPTIIDTAGQKRHGLLERLNRKFGIKFSFMCITAIVARQCMCNATIVARHCMCNATIILQVCMCIVETPLRVIARALVFKTSPHVLTPNSNSGSDLVLVCASQQMSRDNVCVSRQMSRNIVCLTRPFLYVCHFENSLFFIALK
jgi:hypothetical protein